MDPRKAAFVVALVSAIGIFGIAQGPRRRPSTSPLRDRTVPAPRPTPAERSSGPTP